jgi:hypothetical protein
MTTRCDCADARLLAGGIALNEATEHERDSYRAHLANCARCRSELGGERQIERVMSIPAQAREAERWEPDVRNHRRQPHFGTALWKWAAVAAVVALVFLGIRAMQQRPSVAVVAPAAHAPTLQDERAIAVLNNQTMPQREHRAESLVVGSAVSATRNVTLRMRVDARGIPTSCAIAQSSGNAALDRVVCRAVLRGTP